MRKARVHSVNSHNSQASDLPRIRVHAFMFVSASAGGRTGPALSSAGYAVPGPMASKPYWSIWTFLSLEKSQRSLFICGAHDTVTASYNPCPLQRLSPEAHGEVCAASGSWGGRSLGKSLSVLYGAWCGIRCPRMNTSGASPSPSQGIRAHENPLSDTPAFLAVRSEVALTL